MFRLALARGGFWFFGAIIFIWLFGGPDGLGLVEKADYSFWEQLIITVIVGLIVGGCIMSKTWYESLDDERRREKKKRTEAETTPSN